MKKTFIVVAAILFLGGAGCVTKGNQTTPLPAQQNPSNSNFSTATASEDAHSKWKTISVGGVVTLQIPPNCNGEGAAGSTYITCPTPGKETATPEFVISSDGIQVNIRRWENFVSPYWDDVIASLKIITPLHQAIQIQIDK